MENEFLSGSHTTFTHRVGSHREPKKFDLSAQVTRAYIWISVAFTTAYLVNALIRWAS